MGEFKSRDQVLAFLPINTSKLLARWQEPYQIVCNVGKLNGVDNSEPTIGEQMLQQEQTVLHELLEELSDVLQGQPGCTFLVENHIDIETAIMAVKSLLCRFPHP